MTTKLYHVICEWLRDLIEGTPWQGHVFAVGGCCRDEMMGFEIQDLDLAVDLPNGGVKFARWLSKNHLTAGKPTYFLKYGTAKLHLRRFREEEIELVQTRREQYTRETSRCPEVAFGSIEEDCYRRDFTVNSLYYDITRREMVDITGLGIADMQAGLLRTPMDADETFNDDPVRILRGLRFANRFGWTIHPPVMEALLRHIYRLDIVSRERVHSELCKMLNGPAPVAMMQTLRQTGALDVMIPQMQPLTASPRAWGEAMERLALVVGHNGEARTRMRLASMFMSLSADAHVAAGLTRQIMQTLRFDRPIVSDVTYMVLFAGIDPEQLTNPRRVRAIQNLAATQHRLELLAAFLRALGRSDAAEALTRASAQLVAAGKSGFNQARPKIEAAGSEEPKPGRRRRRKHRRRLPKKHSNSQKVPHSQQ